VIAALLWLGFLLGLRHAFDADHLAAVASLASGERVGRALRVAFAWGVGHAAVLIAAGTAMAAAGRAWPPPVARSLELAVGAALVWLGIGVLTRTRHAAAPTATRADTPCIPSRPTSAPLSRALAIGALHGVEGSGAVVLVALPALGSPSRALAYLAVFGAGSIAGMLACSAAVALPLAAARRFAWTARVLPLAVGASSVLTGASIAARALG
jgi:high-affinity nickel-transport protein